MLSPPLPSEATPNATDSVASSSRVVAVEETTMDSAAVPAGLVRMMLISSLFWSDMLRFVSLYCDTSS